METTGNEYFAHIKGWGVDADPTNEPTHPIKHYTGDDHKRLNYERPTQQQSTVEVLYSNERPSLPAVFGTTLPPSGLSGAIRRFAFKYSESSYGHWLPLLLADRINVVEGLIEDFKKGEIPNIFAERGWKASLKYNAQGVIKKAFVTALVTTAVITYLRKRK